MSVIYNIYNIVIPSKVKKWLRSNLKSLYKWYEPIYQYNYYVSLFKKYSKIAFLHRKSWNDGDRDIDNLTNTIEEYVQETRKKVLQNKICTMNLNLLPKDIVSSVDNIKQKGIDYFCHNIKSFEKVEEKDVIYDAEKCLFWGKYHGKKLFFSSKSFDEAYDNLQFLLYEQAEDSPHRYLTDDFNVEQGDIVFDIGCADGNFSLDVIDRASRCYLFETMDEWQKPLNYTFSDYGEKVEIVHKYVSDRSEGDCVSIDDFCREYGIDHIDMLKADIEGAEEQMLYGASRMLKEGRIKKICICTYHTIDAEKNISKILSNYEKKMSDGYMVYSAWVGPIEEMREPYLVKGVMRARLDNGCL